MNAIVVIADDISGAAELAGRTLQQGLRAEVQTRFTADTEADVVCVDTDTRSLPAGEAAQRVGAVATEIMAARPRWIFKKCDSVLRGSVLAEARVIASAAGKRGLLVVSANPSRGRVVRAGRYFVEGRPLDETVFAHDPEHPRTTAEVAALLGGDLAGVRLPDATTPADVAHQAQMLGDDVLPVGAADFFDALLREREGRRLGQELPAPAIPGGGATLVVCGSAAAWNRRREEAERWGLAVFGRPHRADQVIGALRRDGRVLIGIGDGPATRGVAPTVLAAELAAVVAEVLRAVAVKRVLSEGGATSAAVMRAMGWTRLEACEVSPHGVGALRPVGGGPIFLIKPGSYLWPTEMWPPR